MADRYDEEAVDAELEEKRKSRENAPSYEGRQVRAIERIADELYRIRLLLTDRNATP